MATVDYGLVPSISPGIASGDSGGNGGDCSRHWFGSYHLYLRTGDKPDGRFNNRQVKTTERKAARSPCLIKSKEEGLV